MTFAFFFAGQGSQSLNMMNGFDGENVVRETFDEASAALNEDLWAMMNGDNADIIVQTENTQPITLPCWCGDLSCLYGGRWQSTERGCRA